MMNKKKGLIIGTAILVTGSIAAYAGIRYHNRITSPDNMASPSEAVTEIVAYDDPADDFSLDKKEDDPDKQKDTSDKKQDDSDADKKNNGDKKTDNDSPKGNTDDPKGNDVNSKKDNGNSKKEEGTTQKPKEEKTTEKPKDNTTEAPKKENNTEAPKKETTTEAKTEAKNECSHTWVWKTKTVHHDAVTHIENHYSDAWDEAVYVTKQRCNNCGATYNTASELAAHATPECSHGNWSSVQVIDHYIHHEPELMWSEEIVDKEAYDEEVNDYQYCSKCGKKK